MSVAECPVGLQQLNAQGPVERHKSLGRHARQARPDCHSSP